MYNLYTCRYGNIDVYHKDGVACKLQIIIKYAILFCCKFHMAS